MKKSLIILIIAGCVPAKEKVTFEYAPFSQSVIHISFPGSIADTTSIDAQVFTNIPPGVNETRKEIVTTSGDYYLNIEIDRPTKSFLNIGGEQYNIFLFPQDTSHITVETEASVVNLVFHGKSRKINEYYLEKKKTLGYTDIRFPLNSSLSPRASFATIKANADSLVNQELSFFQRYISFTDLPDWFVDYERAKILYAGAGYKTQMPDANQVMKYFSDSVPANYYDFLNELIIDNPSATLSSYYFWFLNSYFGRNLPTKETNGLSGFKRATKFRSNDFALSDKVLSGYVQQIYRTHLFSDLIQYYSDSLEVDSLARAFKVVNYKNLLRLSNVKSRNDSPPVNLNVGEIVPDLFLVDNLDSMISIRRYKDQVVYINVWATWCGPCISNMPKLNKMIDAYAEDPGVTFLNICINSEKQKWLTSIQKYELKGVNLYAE
jgi:hypothetical protein